MSNDDRRKLERILKSLSPDIGKNAEKLNNVKDSLTNSFDSQEAKRDAKSLSEAINYFHKGITLLWIGIFIKLHSKCSKAWL